MGVAVWGGGGQARIQGGGARVPCPPLPFSESLGRTFTVASEKNPGIHFYSGFREKNTRGGAIRNPNKSKYRLL